MSTKNPCYGGYSTSITVDEEYTLHISDKFRVFRVATIVASTHISPLRRLSAARHKAVLGLGGLGHMC
jgi:uncharacterized zinc-type alcohol dehydrogenase-like protein